MIEEFLHGSGDMHSLVAKKCFPEELDGIDVKDIKKLRPDLRKKAKGPEFAMQFGGSSYAIANSLGCSLSEAEDIANAYWKGFPGIADFKKKGSAFVRKNGYVLMCKYTGHKTYWYGYNEWVKTGKSFTQEFWDDYRKNHKGTRDSIALMVSNHAKEGATWDRKALNSVTQGSGAVILKDSQIRMYHWVVKNGYFGKCLLVNLTHDEANWEYPEELKDFPELLSKTMEDTAADYCKSLPIPAEVSAGTHWIH